jgi:hypothetical protein
MAIVIAPDGTRTTLSPADGREFTLAELQGVVGGYIELVTLNEHQQMWVNEDGHRLGLAYNPIATRLYHMAGGHSEYPVLGTVLVTGPGEVS